MLRRRLPRTRFTCRLLLETACDLIVKPGKHLTLEAVHAEASILLAPVVNWDGSVNTPPHSTGSAVDIEIVNAAGRVIDFGMEIKDWSSVPNRR